MFFRLLMESFRRQRRRKLLAGIAIVLGTTAVTAMLALATTIGDRIHKELAVYGANIVVYPKADQLEVKEGGVDIKPASSGAYLKERDLPKLKPIFWPNNSTGMSPELPLQLAVAQPSDNRLFPAKAVGYWFDHDYGNFKTGASALHPWWRIEGTWPAAQHGDVAVGTNLARQLGVKLGDTVRLQAAPSGTGSSSSSATVVRIVGIVTAGDETDKQILLPLQDAQSILHTPDAISRVEI